MMYDRLMTLVDSESFRLVQVIFYALFFMAGSYMLTFSQPPSVVQDSLGPGFHILWAILLVAGPAIVLIGIHLNNKYTGIWFQFGGDVAVLIAMITHVTSMAEAAYWGKGMFAIFVSVGVGLFTAILALRDLRKVRLINAVAKQLEVNSSP